MLTAGRLRELLHYNHETGAFTWRAKNCRKKVGDVAGWRCQINGYIIIGLLGQKYPAHRLAWLYMTGELPGNFEIDHANRDRADNRWVNLRIASHSQNLANQKRRIDNTSGLKGVSWDKTRFKWQAKIEKNDKQIHLGRFDCPATAYFAYVIAANSLFGEFARLA